MNYKKVLRLLKQTFLPFFSGIIFVACTTAFEEVIHYNDIEMPHIKLFKQDTVTFDKLKEEQARHILNLDEPSEVVTNHAIRSFRINEIIQIRPTSKSDSIRITSYSAKTVYNVTMEIYLPEFDMYIPVVHMDSIPAFSQFEIKSTFTGKRITYRKKDGDYISFHYPYFIFKELKPRLISEDEHFKKLSEIDARWTIRFHNYDWTPEKGDAGSQWRELRAIYAREWIVITTNYAYMMSTEEYDFTMGHFKEVMGKDLFDDNVVDFTPEKYKSEKVRFKEPHTFNCGQTGPSVGGLGGGSTWGVTHWNFYGHYVSYSGWMAITHEFMHCKGYGHSSSMACVSGGWPEFMSHLHVYLSINKRLPYTDRNLLGFHKPENAQYRNGGIDSSFMNDKKMLEYYKNSKITKFFLANPIK